MLGPWRQSRHGDRGVEREGRPEPYDTRHARQCVGEAVRLNHEQIEIAIEQASEQLGEGWRLPSLEELEGLICEECGRPMIDAVIFPGTETEPYWTGEENGFSAKNYFFSVNFFNGWTFGRFPPC